MDLNKVLAGVLGMGAVGALSVSALAVTHRDTAMTGRLTRTVAVADVPAGAPAGDAVAPDMTQSGLQVGMTSGHAGEGHVRVVLRDVKGNRTGQVDIYPLARGGNRVVVYAVNLTPGFHGIHIHATGVCDPGGAKPFASAGGH